MFVEYGLKNCRIKEDAKGKTARAEPLPYISHTTGNILCAYKSITTKMCNKNDTVIGPKIWQFRCYNHIMRSEYDYSRICEYTDTNPLRREYGKYYCL